MGKKIRLVRKKLLLMLAGIFVGLLIVELILRAIGFHYLNPYVVDRDLGFALRPNAEGWWHGEGDTYIRINSAGLRDREHPKDKPAGSLRIAVLGDSFTEAFQVDQNDAWWAVMERALNGCPAMKSRNVEVINFGISGFSTARELILLRTRVWQYAPDIVVLNFTTINDVKDNSKALNAEYAAAPIPYFVYKGNELVIDDGTLQTRNSSFYFRLQQSTLGQGLDKLREHLRILALIDKVRMTKRQTAVVSQQAAAAPVEAADNIFVEPRDPQWNMAWRVTEGLLLLMNGEVRAHGAKFFVVTGTSGAQLWPDPAVRQKTMSALHVDNFSYPDLRIKALGNSAGFPVFILAPEMQQYADTHRVFLHGQGELLGDGHWNQQGHRVAGELIARQLCTASAD
jgi:lysophospholipase L1-like esterase